MTKKDYELIAATIARSYVQLESLMKRTKDPTLKSGMRMAINSVIENFMETLSAENPRFLSGKFKMYIGKLVGEAS